MISALLIINRKGEIIISRFYRLDRILVATVLFFFFQDHLGRIPSILDRCKLNVIRRDASFLMFFHPSNCPDARNAFDI